MIAGDPTECVENPVEISLNPPISVLLIEYRAFCPIIVQTIGSWDKFRKKTAPETFLKENNELRNNHR
jgi:hypothetical protein